MSYEEQPHLDDIDWRILCELQRDARVSYTELGRRVGLTRPAVGERVKRLEEAGIITGYRADVDLRKVGLPLTAFIRVATAGEGRYEQVLALLKDRPEVLECHRVTGSDSYVVKAVLASVEHLQELVERILPYAQPTTSLVLSSPVTGRVVGPSHFNRDRAESGKRRRQP